VPGGKNDRTPGAPGMVTAWACGPGGGSTRASPAGARIKDARRTAQPPGRSAAPRKHVTGWRYPGFRVLAGDAGHLAPRSPGCLPAEGGIA
jgi:hypothetical protein